MKDSAVIAAAGLSSRMGKLKPLLPLGDTTIIGSVIRSLKDAGVGEIVVVTGHQSARMETYLVPFGVRVCYNPDYAASDMLDSLRLGLRALREAFDFVYLTPGDVPLVKPETLLRLREIRGAALRPICGGVGGHPIRLAAGSVPALLEYGGENGLRGFLASLGSDLVPVAVEDTGVTIDVDTPADYQRLLSEDGLRGGSNDNYHFKTSGGAGAGA